MHTRRSHRRRRWRSATAAIPRGVIPVALGLGVSGAGAYLFLGLEAHRLGPDKYAPLAAYWSLIFLIGPGVFSALESETGRQLAAARSVGDSSTPIVRRVLTVGVILCSALCLLTVATLPELQHLFNRNRILEVGLIISFPFFCLEFVTLGVAAGNGRFRSYGGIVAGEALGRLGGAGILIVLGSYSIGALGFVISCSPLLSVLVILPAMRTAELGGLDVSLRKLILASPWLITSVLLTNVLVGAGPVLVKGLAHGPREAAMAAPFLSALLLVKVPLFIYSASAPVLLPSLAGAAAAGDWTKFTGIIRRLVTVLVVAGGVVVVGIAAVGRTLLRVFFGPGYVLASTTLTLLAISVVVLIVGSSLGTSLLALRRERAVATCWIAGVVMMGVVTAALPGLIQRVTLGILTGSIVVASTLALRLWSEYHQRMRQGVR